MSGFVTGASIIGGTALAGAWLNSIESRKQADAINRSSGMQQAAADQAAALNEKMYTEGKQRLEPWVTSGQKAVPEYENLMGYGGDTTGAMNALQRSPGYQFRLNQGLNNLNARIAQTGGMGSGKSLVAGTQYNQDYASNEYQNRLNQVGEASRLGQASAAGAAAQGTNYATTQGNIYTNAANAAGSATIAGANANRSSLASDVGLGLSAYNAYSNFNSGGGGNFLNSPAYRGVRQPTVYGQGG